MERRTLLYKVVEKALFPEARSTFDRLFMDYLSAAGPLSALSGYSDAQFHSAITSTLQHYSNDLLRTGHKETSAQLWNPMISGLLRFILNESDDHELRSSGKKENLPASAKTRKLPNSPILKRKTGLSPSSDYASAVSKELVVNASVHTIDKHGAPCSKPKAKRSELVGEKNNSGIPETISPEVRAFLDVFTKVNEVPIFSSHPWISRNCRVRNCTFCKALFRRTRVSRCGSEAFHACSKDKPCTPHGWFPHVCPKVWRMLRGAHNKGLQFRGKPIVELGFPCLDKWDPSPTPLGALPSKKRKVDEAMAALGIGEGPDIDEPPLDPVESDSGNSCATRLWSDEVEDFE